MRTQPSHVLEVDGKGRKGVSAGGEHPRHRPTAGAGEDAGLELGPGVTITTGRARQCRSRKLYSPLLPPPSSRNPSPQPCEQTGVSQCNYRLSTRVNLKWVGIKAPLTSSIFLIFDSLTNFRLIWCLLVFCRLGLVFIIITIITFMHVSV